MSKEPKNPGLPGTEESDNRKYMQRGLHVCKIKAITQNVKDDKVICDKNGNPSLKITFVNKAGEEIDQVYYYSPYPLGDPKRKAEATKCKSEFKLHHLKSVMGFGTKEVPDSEVKKVKLWVAVALQAYFDAKGEPVMKTNGQKTFSIVKEVFPYDSSKTDGGRPELPGDPDTDPEHFKSGYFYEKKEDKSALNTATADIAEEDQGPAVTSETPVDIQDQPAGDGTAGGASDW